MRTTRPRPESISMTNSAWQTPHPKGRKKQHTTRKRDFHRSHRNGLLRPHYDCKLQLRREDLRLEILFIDPDGKDSRRIDSPAAYHRRHAASFWLNNDEALKFCWRVIRWLRMEVFVSRGLSRHFVQVELFLAVVCWWRERDLGSDYSMDGPLGGSEAPDDACE